RQAAGLVLLGDRDDEPEGGVDELALGVLAVTQRAAELALLGGGQLAVRGQGGRGGPAARDGLGPPDPLGPGQQVVAPDVLEVEPDQVLVLGSVDAVVSHFEMSLSPGIPAGSIRPSGGRRAGRRSRRRRPPAKHDSNALPMWGIPTGADILPG